MALDGLKLITNLNMCKFMKPLYCPITFMDKMHIPYLSLYLSLMSFCSFAISVEPSSSPLQELNDLIISTEQLVHNQKTLLRLLQDYLALRADYLEETNNRELLLKTAKVANQALDIIKKDRFSSLFEPSFISEMTLFAKLAARPAIPPLP
jgi:hypothetical protein